MAQAAAAQTKTQRFLTNVLWSWTGVATNLLVGVLLQPYIIRRLGAERYGIWGVIFSILDYLWFFDLGLNAAIANFCARYLVAGESTKINEVINTALVYFSLLSLATIALTFGLAHQAQRFFNISPAYREEFSTLVLITGVTWGLCLVLHMFLSALEGFQRFDLSSRVWVAMLALRSLGYLLALKLGYGLVQMALVFVFFQVLGYLLNFHNFRSVFRELRFSRALVRFRVFREIVGYGVHSFLANSSDLLLNQSAPVLIGHYLPIAFSGFYALPSKILQYAVDAVGRVGLVTRSSAAELTASGRDDSVLQLGIYSNRYSFALFMPVALALLVYGRQVILIWVGPEFARYSAPLLPIFLAANALVMAGQYNSSAILYGLSEHHRYARGMMVESVGSVLGMLLVIPHFGIMGAACVSSACMILVRGVYTPFVLCRRLQFNFFSYLRLIYLRPILTGLPVLAFGWFAKTHWIAGRTWYELVSASALIGLLYAAAALFICVVPEHRGVLLGRVPMLGKRLAVTLSRA